MGQWQFLRSPVGLNYYYTLSKCTFPYSYFISNVIFAGNLKHVRSPRLNGMTAARSHVLDSYREYLQRLVDLPMTIRVEGVFNYIDFVEVSEQGWPMMPVQTHGELCRLLFAGHCVAFVRRDVVARHVQRNCIR